MVEAVDAAGSPAPMRVELLCYNAPDPVPGSEPRWVVPFPEEFWRTGGGKIDFERMWKLAGHGGYPPRIPAFRYRVWMDVSAVDGFNNETPVFDSISMGYRSTGALFSVSEE